MDISADTPLFPKHRWLALEHNPHLNRDVKDLKALIKEDEWDDNVWVTPECKQQAIEKNDVWILILENPGKLKGMHFIASPFVHLVLEASMQFAEADRITDTVVH